MHAHHLCSEFAFVSHVLHFLQAQKKRHGTKKTTTRGKKSNTEATGRSDIQAPQKQKRNLQTHIENKKKDKCANKKQKSSRDTRR